MTRRRLQQDPAIVQQTDAVVTDTFVPRSISFEEDRKAVSIDAETALADPRLMGRPLILLGEAGSGKSELLRHWGGEQVATARQLMNGWLLSQGRSFVDGLDEAAGLHDGDALDRLLGILQAQRNTDFVIACRVADWRSASGAATVKQWTGTNPLELTIEPLGNSETLRFLQTRSRLTQDEAEVFTAHYADRGLGEWLGNPQTLSMLADLWSEGKRPETTGALFEQYVKQAWREPRKQNTLLADSRQEDVLIVLGALFTALIVGGYDALTLAPCVGGNDSELPLAEAKALPGVSALSDKQLKAFLDSRLVMGAGNDRFTYQHRRIGEYLGARWLAALATTNEVRARVLGALKHGELVPSNLRGLWGWLAEHEFLATDAISTDPLAVLDYGNADTLNAAAARALLVAIERAEDEHQPFGWREYRAAALMHPTLRADVERVLAVPGEKRFSTQFILLSQMRDAEAVLRHQATLRTLMLDEARPYGTRDAAAHALANHGALNDWPTLISRLAKGTRESLRLALVLMCNPNVGLTLSDAEFAEAVYAYSGLTGRFSGGREVGTVGLYYYGSGRPIPDGRLDGVLDALTDCAQRYPTDERNADGWDVQRLFNSLLQRRIKLGNVDAEALWRWLNRVDPDHYSGAGEEREWLDDWLRENDPVRRALQRKVLDSSVEEPRSLRWRLHELARGLHPTPEDVVALLDWLPETDSRWREVIWFAPPREEGEGVRTVAERHVRTDNDRQILRDHADPPPPPVDEEHRAWMERHERERRERREKLCLDYLAHREQMRSGFWGALASPAQVYMGRVHESKRDLPPEQRIGAWIGDDLQVDALAGFEAFLTAEPVSPPTATQIAESNAENRHWAAALILSAALAERLRNGRGFVDLPTERLQAGLFAERVAFLDDNEWEGLSDAVIAELKHRGAWLDTARLFIAPQLRKRRSYVSWLWRVLASDVGSVLAAEWLRDFPRVAAEPEEAMIDKLLGDRSDESREVLVEVAKRRRKQRLDAVRRRNWQAVELIVGSLPPVCLSSIASGNASFLWVLRDRMGGRRRRGPAIDPSPPLLAEIISTFAPLWPQVGHPTGVMMGDTNEWDASDFLAGCLDTLAADPSEAATAALATIADLDYGYAWKIKRTIVDQRRARANAEWQPHKVGALAKLVTDGPPVNHADLQRVLLSELDVVQNKITSNDASSVDLFYNAAKPKLETECDAALVTLLRQDDHRPRGGRQLMFTLQPRLSGTRAGDIWCTCGNLAVAVECKRHWHADVWTAFDWQLSQQQAADWRARDHGVYVVYWFGHHAHPVTNPPRGSGIARPQSASELETALRQRIAESRLVGISVKVLDVSRPVR